MIVGNALLVVIMAYTILYVPVDRMIEARRTGYTSTIVRWASFLTCAVVVVPVLWLVPSWIPFRNDAIVCALIVLSSSDAAVADVLMTRYVHPYVTQIRMFAHLKHALLLPNDGAPILRGDDEDASSTASSSSSPLRTQQQQQQRHREDGEAAIAVDAAIYPE